jgi:hypothetical protein
LRNKATARAGQAVGRVATQRDEIRDLAGLDAIAFAHLGRPDARHLAGPHRVEDRRSVRGELKRIAVARRDEHAAASPLLRRNRRGEKIIGLVTGRLREGEAACRDELGQDFELLDQLVVELPPALVIREQFLAIGRRAEGVPADQHGARSFVGIEVEQEIAEPDDRAAAAIALAADRLRQGVIRAMREIIAVDDKQRPGRCSAHNAALLADGLTLRNVTE